MRLPAFCLMVLVAVVGCQPKKDSIVGTWYGQNGLTVTFSTDGSFSQTGQKAFSGKWKAEDEKFIVSIDRIDNKPIDAGVKVVSRFTAAASSETGVAKIKKLLSHIEYTISKDGKSVTQSIAGMPPTDYTRAKPK